MRLELKNTERNDYYYEEAIKTLRTNIQFCGSSLKTILFTSTVSGEGKSATTVAVASSLGSIGKKVLLVDADIRKSVLVKRHEISGRPNGLSQYLSGQKKLGEVIYHTNMENVDMILAGPYSPNPAELLEDELFKVLLENARELYDYILRIGQKWVSAPYNVDGWRLDVAADLGHSNDFNHQFWKDFRKAVKAANPNAIILAEHYGNPEGWLQGDEWDTVMN